MITYLEKSNIFPQGMADVSVPTVNVVNIVVTRFFVTTFRMGQFRDGNFDEYKYLKYRCELFMKVCYPSIVAQLALHDKWYLLVSEPYVSFVREQLGNIDDRVIIGDFSKANIVKEINCCLENNKLPCVTRIDNDDTLSLEYLTLLKRVSKKLSEKFDYAFVIFPCGLQFNLSTNDCYWMMYNVSHTSSIFYNKPLSDNTPLWLYNFDHTKIFESNINVFINNTTLPMWSENITDTNQANRQRENLVKVSFESDILKKLFPSLFS